MRSFKWLLVLVALSCSDDPVDGALLDLIDVPRSGFGDVRFDGGETTLPPPIVTGPAWAHLCTPCAVNADCGEGGVCADLESLRY